MVMVWVAVGTTMVDNWVLVDVGDTVVVVLVVVALGNIGVRLAADWVVVVGGAVVGRSLRL